MALQQISEAFIGTFIGAILAFIFGIATDRLNRIYDRKRRIRIFISYIIENLRALRLIRDNLKYAISNDSKSNDNFGDLTREAMRKVGDIDYTEYKLYSLQDDYMDVLDDINSHRKLYTITVSSIRRIVYHQEKLYLKQLDLIKEDINSEDVNELYKNANLAINEINLIEGLMNNIMSNLKKNKLIINNE